MIEPAITLRPFEHGDIEQYRSWINDPETMRLLGRHSHVSREEHEEWYGRLQLSPAVLVRAIVATGDYVGNVWLWDRDVRNRKAEVRIVIGPRLHRGLGLGSRALREITAVAFEQEQLHRLYAYVLEYNPVALHTFLRAGFRLEGILHHDRFLSGEYYSTYLLSLCQGERR